MKKIISSVIVSCIILALVPLTAFAGVSGSVSASEIETGKNVSVTFSFSYDKEIGSVQGNISYDSSKLKFVSSSSTMGGKDVNAVGDTLIFVDVIGTASDAKKTYSFTATFTALQVGSTTVRLNETNVIDFEDAKSLGSPSASVNLNVKAKAEEKLSADCNLKMLQPPAGCTLEPKFSSAVTEYSCTVPYSVEKFPLEPTKNDPKASVAYSGSVALKVGDNVRSVKVTAQDGTTKTYTVKIKRLSEAETAALMTPAPTADVPQQADIIVTVDGKEMVVSKSMITAVPDGFTAENFDYEGTTVQSAVLGGVRLLELADGEECGLYVFDGENKTFEKFISYTTSNSYYTMLGTTDKDLSEYEKITLTLDNNVVIPAWTVPAIGEEYYIISVMNNQTGEKYLALYCAADKSIQKLSEKMLGIKPAEAEAEVVPEPPIKNQIDWKPIITYGLIALGTLAVAAGITVMIIVIVKNNKKKVRTHDWGSENDQFGEEFSGEKPDYTIYTGNDSDFE